MKKILLVSLALYTLSAAAQIPNIQWQKSLGGGDDDRAYSIVQTTDSGYAVVGYSKSTNANVTGNNGNKDYWVVKLNTTGSIQWQKSLGGSAADWAQSIIQTTDGGYAVAGYSASNDSDVIGNHGGNYYYSDYWVAKLDTAGNIQWQKTLGGSNDEWAYSIIQTTDGGYAVAGYSASNDGDVTGNHGANDYWIVKLDTIGNIQWQKSFGGSSRDEAYSIRQTADGGYIVAGATFSNNGDVTGFRGYDDYWIVKLDTAGNLQWQKTLGGSNADVSESIVQTTDGGYAVAGYTVSNDGDVTGNHGSDDYWIVKLDTAGNLQWQKAFGSIGGERPYSIIQTVDGGYAVAGNSGGNVLGQHGGQDDWVLKLDTAGNLQWQKALGGSGGEDAYSIIQTADGGYIIAGDAYSNNGDVSGNHGNYDYWVVKLPNCPPIPLTLALPDSVNDTSAPITLTGNPTGGVFTGTGVSGTIFNPAFGASGYNLITYAYTNGGCAYSASDSIFVYCNTHYYSVNASICNGQSYHFGNSSLTVSGTYTDTLQNVHGCDSIVTLYLTVNQLSATSFFDTICSGHSYHFGNSSLIAAGTYTNTLQNIHGCDSIVTLHLIVNPLSVTSLFDTICYGQSYSFAGLSLTASGTYKDTLQNVYGCDSVVSLTLHVTQVLRHNFTQTICTGDSYSFNGQQLSQAGIYTDTLTNTNGCDSIVTLSLIVTQVFRQNITQAICAEDIYYFNGQQLSQAGTYIDTLISRGGCDSIVTLHLSVVAIPDISAGADTIICHSDTVQLNAGLLNPTACVPGYTLTQIPYNNIISTGTTTAGPAGDDVVTQGIAMPFPFQFFCNVVDSYFISTNGFIAFNNRPSSGCCFGQLLPNPATPNNLVTMIWEDLNTNSGGNINYFVSGTAPNRVLVVRWNNVGYFSGGYVNGEIHLYETTNVIEIHASAATRTGQTNTIGIENETGTTGYSPVGFNADSFTISTPVAFRFTPQTAGNLLTSVLWTPSTGLTSDTILNPKAYVSATTTYAVAAAFANGCMTYDSVTLTKNSPSPSVFIYDTIYSGQSYQFGNLSLTASGSYTDTLQNGYGCDSVVILYLTVSPQPCYAHYTLYPDTTTPHNWFALNQAIGTGSLTYLWAWGDGNTSTGATPSHVYATAGNYNICLTVSDTTGCSNTYCDSSTYIYKTEGIVTVNVVSQLPTGILELSNNFKITVYPNPATKQLNINLGGLQAEQVSIYNVDGKLVSEAKQPQANRIDISSLATGVYIVEVKVRDMMQRVRWVKM